MKEEIKVKEADRQISKKRWFSRPCAQSGVGEFGSSVYRSGGSICSGGETRCSAVWSAHLFWVQRAIGSNPVTLMFCSVS